MGYQLPTFARRAVGSLGVGRDRHASAAGVPALSPDWGGPGAGPLASHPRPVDAAAVSDQLRRTLALITGYSQTLLHLQLDEDERRHYLNGMVRAVENLSDQAEEILDMVADQDHPSNGRSSMGEGHQTAMAGGSAPGAQSGTLT